MASLSTRMHCMVFLALTVCLGIHCGGSGGNGGAFQYSQPSIGTTAGQPIIPDQPLGVGNAPAPCSVAPALPGGMTLDPDTGILSGTPVAPLPTNCFRVMAANGESTEWGWGYHLWQKTLTVNP
jgi:hypothetical protein